jgi:hypothetical protein
MAHRLILDDDLAWYAEINQAAAFNSRIAVSTIRWNSANDNFWILPSNGINFSHITLLAVVVDGAMKRFSDVIIHALSCIDKCL